MDQPQKSLLIIFYRNPKMGAVKTRLAATIGKKKALSIFNKLAVHTKNITESLTMDKIVFYSDSMDLMDIWPNATYLKTLQKGEGLGDKMEHAFTSGFESGYDSICIIGTDCYELTSEIVTHAFQALQQADVVIGPALDGGYYLLGMGSLHVELFRNKRWSTQTVFQDTLRDIEALGLNHVRLQQLRDVDTEDDLPEELKD
jgi:Uncharacterized protein conserved in bacteria